jgi:threonine synthase
MRWFYRCPGCGAKYAIEPGRYLCDACAAKRKPDRPLEGVLECEWEAGAEAEAAAERIPLPVEAEYFPPIPVGDTPLWAPARLREELGLPSLFVKDDTSEPTGSFKDRASYLVAAFAKKHALREIVLASTGNAASSMSGVGAAAGLKITVFLPEKAPAAKRIQVLQYGADLHQVAGTYDVAYEESLAYSAKTGALSRNTAYNPLTIEGKKTVSFEIAEDLARAKMPAGKSGGALGPWLAPDEVFVPVGDGVIIAGVYKGFEDLMKLGRISRMPRIWACQASGSSAIARALETGGFGAPRPSDTIADSIAVDVPRNGAYALAKLKKYSGRAVVVSDEEILAAQRTLASKAGLFAEPSSSAALAGLIKARSEISKEAKVVVLITGSGLKDVKSAAKGVGVSL